MRMVLCSVILSLALIVGVIRSVPGAQQQRAQKSSLEDCLAECGTTLGQSGSDILGECKGGCWHREAIRIKSPDKCDVIFQEEKYGGEAGYQNCVSDVASIVGDYKICRRITDQAWRDACRERLAIEAGNIESCMEIETREPSDMRTQCFYGMALASKKPEICVHIESKDVRDDCKRVVGGLKGT